MNILVISQYYYPEPFKINEICEEMVGRGHQITVLTGLPNYPEGEIFEEYKGFNIEKAEMLNGVKVIRVPIKPRKKGSINLVKNYISYVTEANKRLKKLDSVFDLVFVYQLSPILMAIPAIKFHKRHRIPLILYCLDLWPESIKTIGINEGNIIFKVLRRLSKAIYKSCDKICVSSPSFIDYLASELSLKATEIEFIPQHGEEEYLEISSSNIHNPLVITYAGNIGKAQDFTTLLRTIKEKDLNVHVRIIGNGSMLEELEQMIFKLDLIEKISLEGRKNKCELKQLFNETDVLYITLKNNSLLGNTLPTKLQTYMAVGKPILANIGGDAKKVIEESSCGLVSDFGDIDKLATNIKKISENYMEYCVRGRLYFEKNFTLAKVVDEFENLIKGIKEEY
ncbi:glycosyltransferase family 4 protein [[Eubacterium] hominis]|uniref:glycosyltransferase family 4 protein n=1 Tax=[Eubacterium] hominis TaxID=2764325 RepID=UPI003A4E4402